MIKWIRYIIGVLATMTYGITFNQGWYNVIPLLIVCICLVTWGDEK